MSKAAIVKMLLKKVAALLGSKIFIKGSNTRSYCVFIMDHSWFNEAESAKLKAKFPRRAI